jgi:hypothetical protein
MPSEVWEVGLPQKVEEVFAGRFAPLLRNYAASAALQHTVSIAAYIDATLPHLDFLVKLRYPSSKWRPIRT